MSVKTELDQIRSKIGEEKAKDVETLLKTIEQKYQSLDVDFKNSNDQVLGLNEELRRVNTESKNRKLDLRKNVDQLQDYEITIQQLKDNLEKLKSSDSLDQYKKQVQPEIDGLKTENEKLKSFQAQIYTQNRNRFQNVLEQIKEHPSFEKIQGKIKLPELKENKYNYTTLGDDEIMLNLNKLNEYTELGLFGDIKPMDTDFKKPKVDTKVEGEIDIERLAWENPAEARKILDRKYGRGVLFKPI